MAPLHVLHLNQVPILEQLQIEEALLRADQCNWCLLNQGSPSAIVMGISGQPHELIHQERFKQAPVPLIRRFSGGGTVFIDEKTWFVTFICQSNFLPISPFPRSIMQWTEQLYQPLFHPYPFQLKENDYVLGEKKCGGNAQSIIKQRWLHHSSWLWDFSEASMDYLLIPKKAPTYRQERTHSDFLCRLQEYWSHDYSFGEGLKKELKKHFRVKEMDKKDILPILGLPHRKATTCLTWEE